MFFFVFWFLLIPQDTTNEYLTYFNQVNYIRSINDDRDDLILDACEIFKKSNDYQLERFIDIIVYLDRNRDRYQSVNPVLLRFLYLSVPETSLNERYSLLLKNYKRDYSGYSDKRKCFIISLIIDKMDMRYDFEMNINKSDVLFDLSYEKDQDPKVFVYNKRNQNNWIWYPDLLELSDQDIPIELEDPTFDDILKYVYNNIRYQLEPKNKDFHQKPKETLDLKAGDCEDFSILVVALSRHFGFKVDVVAGVVNSNDILTGHAWVVYEGKFYGPTTFSHQVEFITMEGLYTIFPYQGKNID